MARSEREIREGTWLVVPSRWAGQPADIGEVTRAWEGFDIEITLRFRAGTRWWKPEALKAAIADGRAAIIPPLKRVRCLRCHGTGWEAPDLTALAPATVGEIVGTGGYRALPAAAVSE